MMINNQLSTIHRKGAALLVVLFIVMTITILAVGFLSRSDVELACGQNMVLRTQMDYLVESGLQHAKGLILNPQDVDSEYWAGATGQQLAADGEDYYDVTVVRDASDRCNYVIDCNSYRLKGGEKVGRSGLTAQLRLDPCIALWTGGDTTLWSGLTIDGDVYCGGGLANNGVIDGDVFADALTGSITGRHKAVADLSLIWPQVKVNEFTANYTTETISLSSLSGVSLGSLDPVRICYSSGSLTLAGNVSIDGMLIVSGDLTVQGDGNIITAGKNLPALFVTGDVKVEGGGSLQINGLAVLNKRILVNGNATDIGVLGGLFVKDIVAETTADSSGNGNIGILYNGPAWRPFGGQTGGALEFDGADDRVDVPTMGSYLNGLSSITVSLWVKSDVTDQDRDILFTREPTGLDEELGIRYDKSGAFGGGTKGVKASIRTIFGYTQIESSSNVQTTAWQHLAIVWESGSSLKLYINGALDTLRYDPGPLVGTVSGVQKLMLGCGTKGQYWDGMIDDVRIYNRALDANDIYPPVDGLPGIRGHWRLDEAGSGPISVTAAPAKTAVVLWSEEDAEEKWGQAAGAFFRSIGRK